MTDVEHLRLAYENGFLYGLQWGATAALVAVVIILLGSAIHEWWKCRA